MHWPGPKAPDGGRPSRLLKKSDAPPITAEVMPLPPSAVQPLRVSRALVYRAPAVKVRGSAILKSTLPKAAIYRAPILNGLFNWAAVGSPEQLKKSWYGCSSMLLFLKFPPTMYVTLLSGRFPD